MARCHHYAKFRTRAQASGPWAVPDLCRAYDWPTGLAGAGAIGIVELGGGWTPGDVAAFVAKAGIPAPAIVDVVVDGAGNVPGQSDADGEVALDIQVAATAFSLATGRPAQIRMYWTSDIAAGVRAAIADKCTTVSISWGAPENEWSAADAAAIESAAILATNAGIAVFAAAGDNDADDGENGPIVDCPAAAPHVIACGGTSKPHGGVESVWNNEPGESNGSGTGGGYSELWNMPAWQATGGAPAGSGGRMVPDVAANADPDTGYEIIVNGQWGVVGGTSAVAPLYAGLFAAIEPFPSSISYLWTAKAARAAMIDITTGDNGAYAAQTGPDPCTGLGAPNAAALAQAFLAGVASQAAQPAARVAGAVAQLQQRNRELANENRELRAQLEILARATSLGADGREVGGGPTPKAAQTATTPTPRPIRGRAMTTPSRPANLPPVRKIISDPGAPRGPGGMRPSRARPRPPAWGTVPPGARRPAGAIRVDSGSAGSTFRGRRVR